MSKIIAITNQKGGVGKTTSTVNLGASLALLKQKVLLIDIDPQGNATSGVGINKGDLDKCVYNLLVEDYPAKDVIVSTEVVNKHRPNGKSWDQLSDQEKLKFIGKYLNGHPLRSPMSDPVVICIDEE